MQAPDRPGTVIFDVIGTLFSLESQRPRLIACGLPGHALETWFAASLRDLFALGVTGRTAPMLAVLEDNLQQLLAAHHLRRDGHRVAAILEGMKLLDPDPAAHTALTSLRSHDIRCAALSNGSLGATEALLDRAGLSAHFSDVLSIDSVGLPKPRIEVYRAMATRLETDPHALLMVAAHPWDLHGAHAAGLTTAYISRGLPWPESLDAPDFTIQGLADLASVAAPPMSGPGV